MLAWDWSTRLRIRNHRSLLGYGKAETDNEMGRCSCTFWYEHGGTLPISLESFNFEGGDFCSIRLGPSNLSALAACVVNHSYCSAQQLHSIIE